MSFINTDYSKLDSKGYEALPTGEYEIIIDKAREEVTPRGAETLKLDLVIRNDVKDVPELSATNGKYSNRRVFMDNWKRRATQQYDTDGFMYILEAVGVPEGTPINSVEQFCDLIEKKAARVYIKKEIDDYKTQDPNNPEYKNSVAPWNFSATKFKEVNHQFKDQTDNNANTITERDYPF